MAIQTCPTAMIQAPAEHVWKLLTTPRDLQRWSGTRIVKGPDRPLTTGNRIVFRAGWALGIEVRSRVVDVEFSRRLELEVRFPFGIVNREVIVITSGSDAACRVTLN